MSKNSFIKENFTVVITAIASFAAIFVSIAQVWVASIDKDKELKVSNQNAAAVRNIDEVKSERAWKLDVANFMATHRKEIFSANEEGTQIKQIMNATFPPEITSIVFSNLSEISGDEILWLKATVQAKDLVIPRTKVFYDKSFPAEIFDAIPDSIGEGDIDYFVAEQIVPSGLTNGDVRYFRETDKELAEDVREDFKRLGCLVGYKINLALIPLTQSNIQNPGNYIEVWLSSGGVKKLKNKEKC